MTRVVILAAGRGTRMRREAPHVHLDAEQERFAARGLKGLIPIHGRPFLDYVLSAVADAGFQEVCLVVGPGRDAIRAHYESVATERVRISFAVQEEPLGSAHALLAAQSCVAGDPFITLNSDNHYPARVLEPLRDLAGSGLTGFERSALISRGNVPEERLAAYALVTTDDDGYLADIVEKPDSATLQRLGGTSWISMTCWRFGPSIFAACRAIAPSSRGEYELPDAVLYAVRQLGERFRVIPIAEGVLDLSSREDIPLVTERLAGLEVRL